MADTKQYARGANAKLAGLPYDPKRGVDWRMGWLEARSDLNEGVENLPADWLRQIQAYRNAQQNPDQSEITVTLKLTAKQANALMQLCHHISLSDRRKMTTNDDEAYQLHSGLQALQAALSDSENPHLPA